MTHVPETSIHRFVGDPFELRVTVTGLTAGQATVARFACSTVVKTIGSGITVTDASGVARLDIDITRADTETIGNGGFEWQAAAGGTDPPIVAKGVLTLDPRL